jgi:hypothetical protein
MEKGIGKKGGGWFSFVQAEDRIGTVLAYLREQRVVLPARGLMASQEVDGFIPRIREKTGHCGVSGLFKIIFHPSGPARSGGKRPPARSFSQPLMSYLKGGGFFSHGQVL